MARAVGKGALMFFEVVFSDSGRWPEQERRQLAGSAAGSDGRDRSQPQETRKAPHNWR